MTYELIIIGGGPAGTAAAVYAARKQLSTLIIASEFGGQSNVSEEIYNWIGTPAISGANLAKAFETHVKEYEGEFLVIKKGFFVEKIEKKDGNFVVKTSQGESFEGKSVLITTGSGRRKLSVLGAAEFDNRGVVYCASCDGPLFSGQDVVVIGGGNAGFESAAQLLAYAKSVTLLHHGDMFKADPVTVKKVLAHPKMTGILNAEVTSVKGEKFVTGITYKDKMTNTEKELAVVGVFVEIGQIPNTKFVEGLVEFDEFKRVKIDPWTQSTTTEGVWAAGDCSNIRYHQNNIAAGDGVRALEDIYLWLRAK